MQALRLKEKKLATEIVAVSCSAGNSAVSTSEDLFQLLLMHIYIIICIRIYIRMARAYILSLSVLTTITIYFTLSSIVPLCS